MMLSTIEAQINVTSNNIVTRNFQLTIIYLIFSSRYEYSWIEASTLSSSCNEIHVSKKLQSKLITVRHCCYWLHIRTFQPHQPLCVGSFVTDYIYGECCFEKYHLGSVPFSDSQCPSHKKEILVIMTENNSV